MQAESSFTAFCSVDEGLLVRRTVEKSQAIYSVAYEVGIGEYCSS